MYAEDTRASITPEAALGARSKPQASPVADVFLSDVNMAALQQAIRFRVYVDSGKRHVVGYQSTDELMLIARSTYLMYARNLPFDVVGQVRTLNSRVLEYAVPMIVSAADMHVHYLRDSARPPQTLPKPQATSVVGQKAEREQLFR
jgi:hypothetical protein